MYFLKLNIFFAAAAIRRFRFRLRNNLGYFGLLYRFNVFMLVLKHISQEALLIFVFCQAFRANYSKYFSTSVLLNPCLSLSKRFLKTGSPVHVTSSLRIPHTSSTLIVGIFCSSHLFHNVVLPPRTSVPRFDAVIRAEKSLFGVSSGLSSRCSTRC